MKLFLISVLFLVLVIQRCHCSPAKTFSINQYLNKYGYMASDYDEKPPPLVYHNAIAKFQKYAGLSVTGKMDSATEAKLTGPRCGAKDFKISPILRMRRFVEQGTKWKKMDLTYSIHNRQPTRKISSTVVRTTLEKTFKMWQDVTQLSFRRLSENDPNADIIIKFGSGQHGDGYPFDNTGGTLAHGFYPHNNEGIEAGDVDSDVIYTFIFSYDTPLLLYGRGTEIRIRKSCNLIGARTVGYFPYPTTQSGKS